MAKVVAVQSIGKSGRSLRREDTSISIKRVRESGGTVVERRVLDIGSQTFGSDLTYVFGKNVEKARRDNKRVAGVSDIEPRR